MVGLCGAACSVEQAVSGPGRTLEKGGSASASALSLRRLQHLPLVWRWGTLSLEDAMSSPGISTSCEDYSGASESKALPILQCCIVRVHCRCLGRIDN